LAKYAALEVSGAKKLPKLKNKNWRLKQMVTEHALGIQVLKASPQGSGGLTVESEWAVRPHFK
jgi:hypothetical protein